MLAIYGTIGRISLVASLCLAAACGSAAPDDTRPQTAALVQPESVLEGDEGALLEELLDALNGIAPRSNAWQTGDGMANAKSGIGSVNIPMLRWAVRLYRDPVKFDAEKVWLDFLTFSRGSWMSSEVGSRIYGTWHLMSMVAVYSWAHKNRHTVLEQASYDWLVHWWAFCKLSEAADGRILMVGMRSAGHAPNPGLLEWLYAFATGGNIAYWEAEARKYNLGLRNKFEYKAALLLRADMTRSADKVRMTTRPETVIPHYGLRTRYHFRKTTEGLAVWCENNVNGNTAPVMGAVAKASALDWLPANGGIRIRQKFETATCARVGTKLEYHAEYHGDASLPLPGGTLISEVTLPL